MDADRPEVAGQQLADVVALGRRVAGEQAQGDRLALLVQQLAGDRAIAGGGQELGRLGGVVADRLVGRRLPVPVGVVVVAGTTRVEPGTA